MRETDQADRENRAVVRALWEGPWWRAGAGFAAAAALLLFFHFVWASPSHAGLTRQQRELNQARAEQVVARRAERMLAEVSGELARLGREIGRLASAYPSERAAPVLLRQLHGIAEQSRLSLVAYTPRSPESIAVAGTDVSAMRWSVQLELAGGFHDLARFVDRVGNLPQVIRLRDLAVRVAQPEAQDGMILATATAETLVIEPAGAAQQESSHSLGATAVDDLAPPSPVTTTYDPEGRQDPFMPLPAAFPSSGPEERPAGLRGIAARELALRGIVLASGAPLAVLESPGGRSWLVRGGERLLDGVVGSIGADAVDIVSPPGAADPIGMPLRLPLGAPALGIEHEGKAGACP